MTFCEPRHGRLIQAQYNKFGILKVRASPIYSFVKRDEAPWNLFLLRYHASVPYDGADVEFGDDQVESEYVTSETQSRRTIDESV